MSTLTPPGRDRVSLARHAAAYPAGAKIYGEGEIGTEMYTIRSGEVEITRMVAGEPRVLAHLRQGDFFGERSLLEDLPREETARARTDAVLVRLNRTALETMLKSSPEIAIRMMTGLSRRAREAEAARAGETGAPAAGVLGRSRSGVGESPLPSAGSRAPSCAFVSEDRATRFPVREGDTIIGRGDAIGASTADIDLTALDPRRSVSQKHARLYRIGGTDYLMEEIGVVNGTYINDVRLRTGAPAVIRHGNLVRFGLVTLTFWKPE